jgi:hypothetical protein
MVRYEIHVNTRNISKNTEDGLVEIDFSPDPFLPSGFAHTPANHFTWETYNNSRLRDRRWNEVIALLRRDARFEGYAESETVSEDYCVKFDNFHNYDPSVEFPLRGLKTIQLPDGNHKTTDIHVKRSVETKRDSLDSLLNESGFYEIHTPRNRIFTLHTEWIGDAKTIFAQLKDYFPKSGGVKGMEMEVVSDFYRSPGFPLADTIPKGQATSPRK